LNFFAFDIRKALIVLIVIALPLLSINMKRNPGEDSWYRKPFSYAVGTLQGAYGSFTAGVRGTTSMYFKLMGIKKLNIDLQKKNEKLLAELGALTELKMENERLNKLLDFRHSTTMDLLAAKVIALDLSRDHDSIRINRGSRDGLRKLMGVITVEGVVGYIWKIEEDSSQVLVLTDRTSAIDTIVQRTRARGLISGKSRTTCRLRYLERADDVAPGDTIVTSGLLGYFPKGFPVGKLVFVKKTDYGISQEAEVAPVVNPSNLEEVFVVRNAGHEDFNQRFGDSDFGPPLLSKTNIPGVPPTAAGTATTSIVPSVTSLTAKTSESSTLATPSSPPTQPPSTPIPISPDTDLAEPGVGE
jgi:rod shape-determining protein MreC